MSTGVGLSGHSLYDYAHSHRDQGYLHILLDKPSPLFTRSMATRIGVLDTSRYYCLKPGVGKSAMLQGKHDVGRSTWSQLNVGNTLPISRNENNGPDGDGTESGGGGQGGESGDPN